MYEEVKKRLLMAYEQIRIGSPFDETTLCGPVHREASVKLFLDTLAEVKADGGQVIFGGELIADMAGNFVVPAITEMDKRSNVIRKEAFVPILHMIKFKVKSGAIRCTSTDSSGFALSLDVGRGH